MTVLSLLVLLATTQAPLPLFPVEVENRQALAPLTAAMDRVRAGLQPKLRIVHFGDSNVEPRSWTGAAARQLSRVFGDAGPGYVLPRPGRTISAGWLTVTAGPGWQRYQVRYGPRTRYGDGWFGVAGAALQGSGEGAGLVARLDPERPAELGLHVLCRPRGGRIHVRVDDRPPQVVDTACSLPRLVVHRVPLDRGPHRVRIHAPGHPVRVLGVTAEYTGGGLVYDTFGIAGHQVTAMLGWAPALLAAQLQERPPDLVIVGYGGNEAFNRHLTLTDYQEALGQALARLRAVAPGAACMLAGPIATCPRGRVALASPRVAAIIAIQRATAAEYGCAFWDSAAVTGGYDALCDWKRRTPPLVSPDGMHLARRGYELLGDAMARALLP